MTKALYLRPSDPKEATKTRGLLRNLGYNVKVAENSSELETAMRMDSSDIIIADEQTGLRSALIRLKDDGLLDKIEQLIIITDKYSKIRARSLTAMLNTRIPTEKIEISARGHEHTPILAHYLSAK